MNLSIKAIFISSLIPILHSPSAIAQLDSMNQGPSAPAILREEAPVIQKQTTECIPPKSIEDVMEALKFYSGCTLNQFMEITGLTPEASVPMHNTTTLYKFVGRAGDGYFTTRRTCILQIGTNPEGRIVQAGFTSAAQSIILNGRGHCLKILRGQKKERGINVPLKDLY